MIELKPIGKQKNIALIAHDNLKDTMVNWCKKNKSVLEKHTLCGTGTTSKRISDATGLNVFAYNSGPLGGDQQIGSRIAEGKIDMVIFFSDPLSAHPHDPDVIFKAMPIVLDSFESFKGKVEKIYLYKFWPAEHILSINLL